MKFLEIFIKKHWFSLLIIFILLVTAVLLVMVKTQREYDKNPGLIPPQKNYDIQVTLTPEQEMEYETNIVEAERKINETIASGKQQIALQSGTTSTIAMIPPMSLFVDKATNLELLGRYNEAIKTINGAFRDRYDKDIYWRNYLAFLYRDIEEYKMAIKLYERIVAEYPEYALDALSKLTQIYVQLWDKEAAGQNYIHYELSGGVRDEGLMEAIRQLK